MKNKYEVGGEVMISGKWYEIDEVDERGSFRQITTMPVKIMLDNGDFDWPEECYIRDYVPPEPKVWFTEENWDACYLALDGVHHLQSVNSLLTHKYGEPPHEEN